MAGVHSNTRNPASDVAKLAFASSDDGLLHLARHAIEPLGIEVLSLADLDLPVPSSSDENPIAVATAGGAAALAATALPSVGIARSFVIDPLLRHESGGPQWQWPVPWPGTKEDLASELLNVDTALVRGGYCGPDDRGAYFHTVICLVWPDAESGIFEGRMDGQFISLTRQRMTSRDFMPDFATCFIPEGEDDVIELLGGLSAFTRDQKQAIGSMARTLLPS